MTTPGQFHHPRSEDRAHDHVVFHMSSGAAIVFNDPRRFGYMKIIARNALEDEPLLKGLGPEPLGNEFDAAMLARACFNKKTSLKAALLTSAWSRVSAISMSARRCTGRICRRADWRRRWPQSGKGGAARGRCRGRADRSRRAAGECDSFGAESGDQGRRFLDQRSSPDLGRTRLFPAFLSGL